jgi:hypothetical protein
MTEDYSMEGNYNMDPAQQIHQEVQRKCGSSGDICNTSQINQALREYGKQKLRSYLKAGIEGAIAGAVVGAPLLGIGAIPGALGGFLAGVGLRAHFLANDTLDIAVERYDIDQKEDQDQ